jgi:hypothetical protein
VKRLLVVLLSLTLAAPPLAAQPASEIFLEGETLDYTVTWMRVTGGTARMTIAPQGDGQFRITSVARSGGGIGRLVKVRDEIETIVDRKDFSTVRYVKKLDEKGEKKEEVTVVEDGVATRTRSGRKPQKVEVPRPILDPISVVYHFRTLELAPGKGYDLTLISDGKIYTVHAKVIRREVVQTPAGRFDTLMVEPEMVRGGVAKEERLFIWYTDDVRHIPVRIRTEVNFGAVTATLKSISSGVKSIEPPRLAQ